MRKVSKPKKVVKVNTGKQPKKVVSKQPKQVKGGK